MCQVTDQRKNHRHGVKESATTEKKKKEEEKRQQGSELGRSCIKVSEKKRKKVEEKQTKKKTKLTHLHFFILLSLVKTVKLEEALFASLVFFKGISEYVSLNNRVLTLLLSLLTLFFLLFYVKLDEDYVP